MTINSTRRKWFLAPPDEPPSTTPLPVTPPAALPITRRDRELVVLVVGAATIGGRPGYGAGAWPVRRNSGRWSG
ncbi:hypothetical protein BDK92_3372 [Micromonospora pisi]|uniref:Uncharacterized protein n=1 Tax=Micromonospora pisi TaxID=589240 RepID=A0A495JK24_9ACTN|nr:hypothetical protein [Micromonospora pisi]RKR89035.1 hypothetical protein BDK92_3372 [Micromonospora pisi]